MSKMSEKEFFDFVFDVVHDVQKQRLINNGSSINATLNGAYFQATLDLAQALIERFNEKDREYSEYM